MVYDKHGHQCNRFDDPFNPKRHKSLFCFESCQRQLQLVRRQDVWATLFNLELREKTMKKKAIIYLNHTAHYLQCRARAAGHLCRRC